MTFNPSKVNSLDILKSFPIITKEILKQNYVDFTPLNIKSIPGVKTSQTGGTTGNILFSRNDALTRSSIWATYKRFTDWMGVKEREKSLILMGDMSLVKILEMILRINLNTFTLKFNFSKSLRHFRKKPIINRKNTSKK